LVQPASATITRLAVATLLTKRIVVSLQIGLERGYRSAVRQVPEALNSSPKG
jgi:hypothetical protein